MSLTDILKIPPSNINNFYYTPYGTLNIFHFSSYEHRDKESLILEPKMFGTMPWSKSEKRISTFPRLFFYLNPKQSEIHFKNKPLFYTKVDKLDIYDLRLDDKNVIKYTKEKHDGILNFDYLFQNIVNLGYKGIYYKVNERDIIIWFEPIKVQNVDLTDSPSTV